MVNTNQEGDEQGISAGEEDTAEVLDFDFDGNWKYIGYPLTFFTALWLGYYLYDGTVPRDLYTTLHLGGALVIVSILELSSHWDKDDREWADYAWIAVFGVFLVGSAIASGYIYLEYDELIRRVLRYTTIDYIMAAILVVATIELTRQRYGWIIWSIVVFSLVYALFGQYFPGIWQHGGLSTRRMLGTASLEMNGIYGGVVQVIAVWVYVFVLYGGFLKAYGSIDFVVDVATLISSYSEKMVPQVAVMSSMFLGSVMSSSMANTAVTGNFTIPMMKKHGIRARDAGAIESVASTGGQIMPPVMASVAFIMAQRVSVPYYEIVLAGFLPAVLFYMSVGFGIYIISRNTEMQAVESNIDRGQFHLAIPILGSLAVLVYLLVIRQMTAGLAGGYTIVSFIVLSLLATFAVSPTIGTLKQNVRNVAEGVITGTLLMAPLTVFVASLGIVVEVLTVTGLANKIAIRILSLAGGEFFLVALLVSLIAVLFGLGMPTLPAYLIVITLTEPALSDIGVSLIVANFFVFYFASLSSITPPIAIAAAIGAKIADAPFVPTAVRAFTIGFPAFILPFVFLYNTELLELQWPGSAITFVGTFLFLAFISFGLNAVWIRLQGSAIAARASHFARRADEE